MEHSVRRPSAHADITDDNITSSIFQLQSTTGQHLCYVRTTGCHARLCCAAAKPTTTTTTYSGIHHTSTFIHHTNHVERSSDECPNSRSKTANAGKHIWSLQLWGYTEEKVTTVRSMMSHHGPASEEMNDTLAAAVLAGSHDEMDASHRFTPISTHNDRVAVFLHDVTAEPAEDTTLFCAL